MSGLGDFRVERFKGTACGMEEWQRLHVELRNGKDIQNYYVM